MPIEPMDGMEVDLFEISEIQGYDKLFGAQRLGLNLFDQSNEPDAMNPIQL